MKPIELILQCLDLIIESGKWSDKKPSEIIHILMYLQSKGWLYVPNIDGKVQAVICAYRIPNTEDVNLNKIPEEENGDILYVPLFFSIEKDVDMIKIVRQSLSQYLSVNKNIKEIVFHRKNDSLRRYTLKGVKNEI